MSTFLSASLNRLPQIEISGFSDEARKKKISGTSSIKLHYLQESLKVESGHCYHTHKSVAGTEIVSSSVSKPKTLKVDFVLDDTNISVFSVIALTKFRIVKTSEFSGSVESQITTFHNICYGEENPNFLKINSSNMPLVNSVSGTFNGQIKSVKVKNELVDGKGSQLKALLQCEFIFSDSQETKTKKSPGKSATKKVLMTGGKAGLAIAAIAVASFGTAAAAGTIARDNNKDSVREDNKGQSLEVAADEEKNTDDAEVTEKIEEKATLETVLQDHTSQVVEQIHKFIEVLNDNDASALVNYVDESLDEEQLNQLIKNITELDDIAFTKLAIKTSEKFDEGTTARAIKWLLDEPGRDLE